jgi:hypothetical protein
MTTRPQTTTLINSMEQILLSKDLFGLGKKKTRSRKWRRNRTRRGI